MSRTPLVDRNDRGLLTRELPKVEGPRDEGMTPEEVRRSDEMPQIELIDFNKLKLPNTDHCWKRIQELSLLVEGRESGKAGKKKDKKQPDEPVGEMSEMFEMRDTKSVEDIIKEMEKSGEFDKMFKEMMKEYRPIYIPIKNPLYFKK